MDGRRPRVLLGSTGSVASIKVAELCRLLLEFADVKLIVTESAKNFINDAELPEEVKPVLGDEAEWRQWRSVGDPVLHIELRRWADVLLLAPLSANSLAKAANGLADNLLTCVVRAWDFGAKPMILAPAMNTAMWSSPFTSLHLDTLTQLGSAAATATPGGGGGESGVGSRSSGSSGSGTVVIVPPVSKRLACGDEGVGAMASPADIADVCRRVLGGRGLLGAAPGGLADAPPAVASPPQTSQEGSAAAAAAAAAAATAAADAEAAPAMGGGRRAPGEAEAAAAGG